MRKIYAYCSIQYPFCEININNYKNTLLLFYGKSVFIFAVFMLSDFKIGKFFGKSTIQIFKKPYFKPFIYPTASLSGKAKRRVSNNCR